MIICPDDWREGFLNYPISGDGNPFLMDSPSQTNHLPRCNGRLIFQDISVCVMGHRYQMEQPLISCSHLNGNKGMTMKKKVGMKSGLKLFEIVLF